MNGITAFLTDKDDKTAYEYTRQLAAASELSDEYYDCLGEFAALLSHEKSYVRTRAFILCCSQSKWDSDGRIGGILPEMLALLNDPKPTVVRQCLKAIKEVAVYRPELAGEIRKGLAGIDISRYKDSMIPLILKDIGEVTELLDETVTSDAALKEEDLI